MPYDGNGTFLPLPSPTFPAVPGTIIYSDYFNLNLKNVHDGLSAALPRNGEAAMSGNLRMAGFKISEVRAGEVPGDLVEWKQWTDTFLNSTYQELYVPNLPASPAGTRVPNVNWVSSLVSSTATPIYSELGLRSYRGGDTYTGTHNYAGATLQVASQAAGDNTAKAASTAFVQADFLQKFPNYTAPITANSAELNRLAGVTSGVQGQINAKGAIAGQTWTGTHNYTGANISVPTLAPGSTGNSAASVDYVNSAAFAAALPSQAGNAGGYISTDGVTASWRNFFADVRAATLTGLSTATNAVVAATDTVLAAIGKLQAQVSAKFDKTGGAIDGNINITGTGRKITGDFSNATAPNRVLFQTSTANAVTAVGVVPNGAGSEARVTLYGGSDPANCSQADIRMTPTEMQLRSNFLGTGTHLPMTFYAGGAERLRIAPTTGNILATGGALGYGLGAGGTAVQSPDNTSPITLNKPNGIITLADGYIAGSTRTAFTLQNSLIDTNSTLVVHGMFDGSSSAIVALTVQAEYVQNGTARISVKNNALSDIATNGIKIKFAVFAGSAS